MLHKSPPLALPTCDDRLLWDVVYSSFQYPTLTVADELGLFPLLEKEAATADEIAARLSIGPRATEAMLAVLTSLGFLVQHQGRFSITDVTRNYLLPDRPYYWGPILKDDRNQTIQVRIWKALEEDTPYPAAPAHDQKSLIEQWEIGDFDPAEAEGFIARMHSYAFPSAMGAARNGDFSGVTRLLDVGGGSGAFSMALAMQHPSIRCTLMDLPAVCEAAQQYIAAYALEDQIDTHAIDMFKDPWPSGYDAVFFSNIFHDWDQKRCLFLGRQSFDLLPSGGRIILHEMLFEDTKDGPLVAALLSMRMFVGTRGKQFSAGELDALLRACGFTDIVVLPTYGYYSLVSGTKP